MRCWDKGIIKNQNKKKTFRIKIKVDLRIFIIYTVYKYELVNWIRGINGFDIFGLEWSLYQSYKNTPHNCMTVTFRSSVCTDGDI